MRVITLLLVALILIAHSLYAQETTDHYIEVTGICLENIMSFFTVSLLNIW